MLTITTPQDTAFFQARLDLDGVPFLLDFAWNARGGDDGTWTVSLSTPDGVPLVSGVSIVSNRLLWKRYAHDTRLPAGDLLAYDATGQISAPGYGDLSTRVTLYYIEAADLP